MCKKKILFLCYIAIMLLVACDEKSAKADNNYDISVSDPKLKEIQPNVLFDESHNNHHKIKNTYKPFASLISNDGCLVKANNKPISKQILSETNIYVIVTAMGKVDPGDVSPFTQQEIDALEKWVNNGGAVLLITEHYPFGLAMAPLLKKFGIAVHNGYTEDTILTNPIVMDALVFEKSKGNLHSTHQILDKVEKINTFTGSSVKGDSTWTPLIMFSPNAQNYNVKVDVKKNGGDIITSIKYSDFYPAKGYAQGWCKQYGKGRVVVLAESAFLTAQIDKNGNLFGMNIPASDNKQFALNVIRWLAEK